MSADIDATMPTAEEPSAAQAATDPPEPDEIVPIYHDEDPSVCSICIHEMIDRERVIRLPCSHVFHATCWQDFMQHEAGASRILCPNCRGPGTVVASWNYVAVPPGHPPSLSPAASSPPAISAAASPASSVAAASVGLPADAASAPSEGYYIIGTPPHDDAAESRQMVV